MWIDREGKLEYDAEKWAGGRLSRDVVVKRFPFSGVQ
jgi:hypothetical protein